jgi:hypothetical protein
MVDGGHLISEELLSEELLGVILKKVLGFSFSQVTLNFAKTNARILSME